MQRTLELEGATLEEEHQCRRLVWWILVWDLLEFLNVGEQALVWTHRVWRS